jgi:hypothetical protein
LIHQQREIRLEVFGELLRGKGGHPRRRQFDPQGDAIHSQV